MTSKLKKVLIRVIQDLAWGLVAAVIVGAMFYFVAMPILRNLVRNVGRPIPANNQHDVILTNQPLEQK